MAAPIAPADRSPGKSGRYRFLGECRARWFCWESGGPIVCVEICPGEGADIATAATAGLALIQTVHSASGVAVPATDGQGGLLIFVVGLTDLQPHIVELAEDAPEIATVDSDSSAGRVWLSVTARGTLVPAPYSLVDSADGTAVVLPLTMDELAAATAGMPLEPSPDEVLQRLQLHGDLAAVLLGR